jgi:hypothetical protein
MRKSAKHRPDKEIRVPSNENSEERYLVGPRSPDDHGHADTLREFTDVVGKLPGASVLPKAGKKEAKRVVVHMTHSAANEMKRRFGDRLIIELDAPLKY